VEVDQLPRIAGRHRNRALAQECRTRAVELVLTGHTYQQVADHMGYANRGTVYRILQDTLQSRQADSIDEGLPSPPNISTQRRFRVHRDVDPGALLLAMFTVGVTALTTSGAWEPFNTILSTVVAIITVCFTWPLKGDSEGNKHFTKRVALAEAVAYGFIATTLLAWPVQSVMQVAMGRAATCHWWAPSSRAHCMVKERGEWVSSIDSITTTATYLSCVLGAVLAAVLFLVLRGRVPKS